MGNPRDTAFGQASGMGERRAVSDDDLRAYVASMPASYRQAFDEAAIEAHAAIVARRPDGATVVETWRDLPERVVGICVVADDQPGLLAQISAALVAHEIDVVAAHAYCRERPNGYVEAIDFLWIRRAPLPNGIVGRVRPEDITAIAELVDALVDGRTSLEDATHLGRKRRLGSSTTRVRFETDDERKITVLTVQAVDRPGLLLSVTRTIFRAGHQIVGLRASTDRGRAVDRFEIAEPDGTALGSERLLALQIAILEAVEASVIRVSESGPRDSVP